LSGRIRSGLSQQVSKNGTSCRLAVRHGLPTTGVSARRGPHCHLSVISGVDNRGRHRGRGPGERGVLQDSEAWAIREEYLTAFDPQRDTENGLTAFDPRRDGESLFSVLAGSLRACPCHILDGFRHVSTKPVHAQRKDVRKPTRSPSLYHALYRRWLPSRQSPTIVL